jgi:hypothetical protein
LYIFSFSVGWQTNECLQTVFQTLVYPRLTEQHVLLTMVVNRDPLSLLFHDLPFVMDADTNMYDISARELADSRLPLMTS